MAATPSPMPIADPAPVSRQLVLYDGDCGLCARGVRFLLDRDHARRLTFAPLQGTTAAPLYERLHLPADRSTMIFLRDVGSAGEAVFLRSDAALAALGVTDSLWRHAAKLRWIPRPIRDAVYNFVARYRHLWGAATCRLPSPGERERFLP